MKSLLNISDLSVNEFNQIINSANEIEKKKPRYFIKQKHWANF